MLGELDFSDEKLQDTIGVLPLQKKQAKIIPENWESQNRKKNTVSTRYRKSYYRFGTFMQLAPFM